MSTRQGNRGNWRGSSSSRRRPPPKQYAKLKGVLTGLLAIALIAGFIYIILIRTYTAQLALVVATTDKTLHLSSDAGKNDAAALRELLSAENIHDWTGETQHEQLSNLNENVANLALTDRNQLLFYMSGQGLEIGGKPYLVPSDLVISPKKRISTDELVDLQPLLKSLAESEASVKLLMIDAGQLQYAPRLRTFANSFSIALSNLVAQLESSEFYVLVSHSPFERSQLVRGRQRTLFGWSIEQALLGEANLSAGHDNERISLFELTNFVNGMVTENTVQQTPCLLQAGVGPIASAPKGEAYQLAKFTPAAEEATPESGAEEESASIPNPFRTSVAFAAQSKEEDPKEDTAKSKSDKTKADNKKEEKTDAAAKTDKAAPAKKDDARAKEPAPNDNPEPPSLKDKLHQAWQLVDAIKARAITPIDFAPRHWRHLTTELVHDEHDIRFSANDESRLKVLEGKINNKLAELRQLLGTLTKAQEANAGSNVMFKRWNRFIEAKKKEAEEAIADETRSTALRKYRSYRKALFEAPSYIQLYATLQQDSPNELRLYVNDIAEFAAAYRRLASQSPITVDDVDELIAIGNDIDDNATALRNQINAKVEAELKSLKKAAAQIGRDENAAIPMSSEVEALLASPFLTADQRRTLTEGFDKIPDRYPLPPIAPTKTKPFPSRLDLANADRKFISNQVAMNLQLLTAADAGLSDKQDAVVEGLSKKSVYENLAKASETWETSYLKVIKISEGVEFEPALQLMDASDMGTGALDENLPLADFDLDIDIMQEHRFAASLKPIIINRSQTTTFSFIMEANDRRRFDSFVWELEFSDIDAEVVNQNSVEIKERVAADNWFQRRFDFTIKTDRREFRIGKTKALLIDKASNQSRELDVRLPRPLLVTLVAERMSKNASRKEEIDEDGRLRVFGNRTTRFNFGLKNESGEKKEVNVRFYALPSYAHESAPGRIPSSLESRIEKEKDLTQVSNLKLIAQAVNVELPESSEVTVPLKLVGNKSTPPPAKEGEPAAKPQPAAENTTWGLVCIIEDKNGYRFPPKWLPIRAMHPSDYITHKQRFDWDQQQMVIELSLDPRNLPSDLADEVTSKDPKAPPIVIQWNPLERPAGKTEALLSRNRMSNTVVGKAAGRGRLNRIFLNVDGMPRMLNFRYVTPGTRNDDLEFAATQGTEFEIFLEQLTTPAGKVKYLGRNATPASEPPPEKGPEIRSLNEFPEAVFGPSEELIVDFRVDAPLTAFVNRNVGEGITVGWGDEEAAKFFADRAESSTTTVQEDGSFLIRSSVSDHRVAIRTDKRLNIKSKLTLKSVTQGRSKHDRDEAIVVFDSLNPKIERLQVDKTKLSAGQILEATLPVQDASALHTLTIGFDKNETPGLDKGDGAPPINLLDDSNVTHAELVSNEDNRLVVRVKTMGLMPRKYRLFARVTDTAGRTSDPVFVDVTLTKPTGSAPADLGTLVLTVQRKSKNKMTPSEVRFKFKPSGAKPKIKELPENKGQFTFKLKPNMYEVRAEFDVRGGATSVAVGKFEVKAGETVTGDLILDRQ